MTLITLRHMLPDAITMEVEETEERAFSTRDKAEQWLKANGFFEGRRSWFDYKDDSYEWCHKDEKYWNYIAVQLDEYDMDMEDESRFKDFNFGTTPWQNE